MLFVGLPAAIFKHIEGWSALESLYFVVITLTTIGFGDFVAGTGPTSSADTRPNTFLTVDLFIMPVDLSSCSNLWSLSASVGVSRRFRDRVFKLLQTSRVVLDSGGTRLLRCHSQHDRILAQSHLQEDEGGGMRTMSFSCF